MRRVRVVAYPQRTYEGYVDRVSPLDNRAKGAVPVRVQIRIPAVEEGLLLQLEMRAVVTFVRSESHHRRAPLRIQPRTLMLPGQRLAEPGPDAASQG